MPDFPATLGACVDLFYELRSKRLALEKDAKELAQQQAALEEHMLQTFDKQDMDGCKGKTATASVTRSVVPTVTDWGAFTAYIMEQKAADLLQRRPSVEACRARWEAGEAIPGVEPFNKVGLSVTKR